MLRQLVFIDESGDAGLTGSCSSRFLIAAVVIVGEDASSLIRAKMTQYRRTLGWHDRDEFKFSRTRKEVLKGLLKLLAPCDFEVYCVVLDKNKKHDFPQANNRYSLYNYVLTQLVKILPNGEKKICIDGNVGEKYRKNMLALLRKQLGSSSRITNLRYISSFSSNELQLADVVAGSIARSFSDKKDAKDYIEIIQDKIVTIKEL